MTLHVSGLSAVAGPCFAGFYCPSGSVNPTEVQCTVGNYCPVGSANPTPCGNGTFSNVIGNQAPSDCSQCNPGYFCNGEGLTNVTGPCKEGLYVIVLKALTLISFNEVVLFCPTCTVLCSHPFLVLAGMELRRKKIQRAPESVDLKFLCAYR